TPRYTRLPRAAAERVVVEATQTSPPPKLRAVIRVECVHAVMLSGNDEHVALNRTREAHGRNVEWLGVHFAIYCDPKKLAERHSVDVTWGEDRFIEDLARSCVVIMVSENSWLS